MAAGANRHVAMVAVVPMRMLSCALLAFLAAAPAPAMAVGPAVAAKTAAGVAPKPAATPRGNADVGRVKAETERCLECHGQPGIAQGHSAGEDGKFARLGGQQHAYIVKQVRDFRQGRRKSDFMAMMANSVSDEDVADIAAYFAAQPAMPSAMRGDGKGGAAAGVAGAAAGAVAGTAAGAAQLYRQGDAGRKVAACAACHGAAGEGIAGLAPVIGGQGRRYISQQLHNWRSGERSNDPAMREAAAGLTDAEIDALALYVSEM